MRGLRRGFTLIEILVVIAVLSILVTIVTLSFVSYQKNASETNLKSDLSSAAAHLERKKVASGGTYPSPSLPSDIKASSSDISFTYTVSPGQTQYCLRGETSIYSDLKLYVTQKKKTPQSGSSCPAFTAEPGFTKQCADEIDNDGDGKIDYPADPGCTSLTDDDETDPPKQCADGIDNDGDGKVDYPLDPGCTDASDDDETDPKQCADGIDNDGDGKIDYPTDPGCSSVNDNDETDPPICSNGKDDDGDGKIDYPADPGCTSANGSTETGPSSAATVSETSYGFPSWHLYNTGGTKPTRSFTFRNPANDAPLRLTTASISGATTSFSITYNGCSNVTLQPNATCSITVQFYPPSGGTNDRVGNAGPRYGTLTVNNSNSVATTSVSLSASAFSDQMGPGDTINATTSIYLVPYNSSCYVNVEACGLLLTGTAWNGNLTLGGTYCLFGGWGPGGYGNYYEPPGNRLSMQTDGNLVFYDPNTYRYASWTNGVGNLWLRVQSDGGGVYLASGSGGGVYKWIHYGGQCFAW